MLYILPPPRTPNPPSPWESILCNNPSTTTGSTTSWKPRRVRLKSLPGRNDDESPGLQDDNMDSNRNPKSLSECYFAGKDTALVLPAAEAQKSSRRPDAQGSNIRHHLQSIVDLLKQEEILKMAVKLESVHPSRVRYLVIVSRMGRRSEESCLLGIDCNEQTTVGLVLKVMADTAIRLDGDGGFSVSVCSRHHIFKPVSVQAMWSALQTLHKVSSKAREQNYFQGGLSHDWVNYYEERIESDRSCLNEWHAMDNLESKRPPSPDSIRTKPTETEETEKVIRTTLKEIMMSVDLDEVTSKHIRTRLEEYLDMDLGEYKSFIDKAMLTILGQMDAPTEIFEHVYLGSEWNASNYDELQRNGVGHILNVTQEIDNFFPGTFKYYNIRVCDDEKTDLLKFWDDTFKYITNVKLNNSKVLVHCKMGISRSASVVIAYAMKAYNWDFKTALEHVKEKRNCIKPNTSFLSQLETYQGILDAMKNREKLQRSKSETNLKSPERSKPDKILVGSEPTPIIQIQPISNGGLSGQDLRCLGSRPKSWSPENEVESEPEVKTPMSSVSLEDLSQKSQGQRHVLMRDNGESYSVSPNHIFHLPGQSVKDRVNELESKEDSTNEKSLLRAMVVKKDTWDPGDSECETQTVWTASTVVKTVPDSINQVPPKDPFSNQVDRVFDREEKVRESPSRQSSWSSYDSAVVLGVGLSRHSSWGSGDTRVVPSRNSSWGSYDMRPRGPVHYLNEKGERVLHQEVFQSGTVRRTKQKIEESTKSSSSETLYEGEKPVNTSSAIVDEDLVISRLSMSAPEASSMDLIPIDCSLSRSASNVSTMSVISTGSVKQHKSFLESLQTEAKKPVKAVEATHPGIVRRVKKEFEAKTSTSPEEKKNKSTPSSPVSLHEKVEEMNFKNLLGIFENKQEVVKRVKSGKVPRTSRFSLEVSSKYKTEKGGDKPPISPVVRTAPPSLVASVIASATKKQLQYGKSHPLAKLTIKPRHNNPLYNTM